MGLLANLSLQKRIALLVFICLTLGLGMFSWLGMQSLRSSTQRTLDERLTMSRLVASHLYETLNNVLVQLEMAATFEGVPATEPQFQQKAKTLVALLAKLDIVTKGVFLLDADGGIIKVEPPQPAAVGLVLPGYADVRSSLDKGLPRISSLVTAPLIDIPVVFATAPMLDSVGNNIGALSVAIDVNASSIGGFIKPITLGNTGYAEVVDKNGMVLARTEPGVHPTAFEVSDHPGRFAQLVIEGKATVRTCHRHHGTETQPPKRKDVLAFAPLSAVSPDRGPVIANWGVAVRQSEEEAFAMAEQLRRRLLIFGAIVLTAVFLLIWVMMQGVVRPIKSLTDAAAKVAKGEFKAIAPLRRRDEIGQLSNAFSAMTHNLAEAQKELVSRNRELSALNSIATTVSQSLNLEDVLAKATQKVLEVTGTEAGWVFLHDSEGRRLKLASAIGSSRLFNCQQSASATGSCACYQVLHLGHPLIVNDVSQCPLLSEGTLLPRGLASFVSVPLKSKERALGVMNIVCSSENCFTQEDFRLLDSIGRHVGLAVENSVLYQETRQKEELRGQLLNAIISAQEDERKRVSREFHDGFGQTLTGLIMSIESAESVAPANGSPLGKKLANARVVAVRALEDMRKLLKDLRSPILDDLGLVAAIRSYAETHLEAAGVRLAFEAEVPTQRLAPAVETALFRIVQEAVHNIMRHAEAGTAWIRLKIGDSKIMVAVEDDGRGFDTTAFLSLGGTAQSFGLVGMRERAAILGGSFSISSERGQGTRLVVEIPIVTPAGHRGTPDE